MSVRECCNGGAVAVRPLAPADLAVVARLEAASPSPWSAPALARELRFPGGLQAVVELAGTGIVGWCAGRLLSPEAELLKIAVAPELRRRGLAARLLRWLEDGLHREGVAALFLEVRGENGAAVSFYRKHGFVEVGIRPGYYYDPPDRALILRKELRSVPERPCANFTGEGGR